MTRTPKTYSRTPTRRLQAARSTSTSYGEHLKHPETPLEPRSPTCLLSPESVRFFRRKHHCDHQPCLRSRIKQIHNPLRISIPPGCTPGGENCARALSIPQFPARNLFQFSRTWSCQQVFQLSQNLQQSSAHTEPPQTWTLREVCTRTDLMSRAIAQKRTDGWSILGT